MVGYENVPNFVEYLQSEFTGPSSEFCTLTGTLAVRRRCLGYRHTGCLQLSHRRPQEMCRLRTHPRTDVDSPRLLY